MVRGDPRCPSFCTTCKSDCRCGASGCNLCHTCRDKPIFNGSISYYYQSNGPRGCVAFSHDCKTNLKDEEKMAEEIGGKVLAFPKLFDTQPVEVIIGKSDPESRFVPKGALVENSEYFKTCFSFEKKANEGVPGTSKALRLETDVDLPDAFDRFIQFAYWKDYYASSPSDSSNLDLALHAKVYVLAERLQAIPLKQLAVRKASKLAVDFVKSALATTMSVEFECIAGIIETIYLNTPAEGQAGGPVNKTTPSVSSDAFRRLIARFSARCLYRLKKLPAFEECVRMFPDFAVDMLSQVQCGKELEVDDKGDLKWGV